MSDLSQRGQSLGRAERLRIRSGTFTGPTSGVAGGDVIVQIQQDKVANAEDVGRAIASARQQQRHFAIVLVRNAQGLRWLSVSLE